MKTLRSILLANGFSNRIMLGENKVQPDRDAAADRRRSTLLVKALQEGMLENAPLRRRYEAMLLVFFAAQLTAIFLLGDRQVILALVQGTTAGLTVIWPLRRYAELLVQQQKMSTWVAFVPCVPPEELEEIATAYLRNSVGLAKPQPSSSDGSQPTPQSQVEATAVSST